MEACFVAFHKAFPTNLTSDTILNTQLHQELLTSSVNFEYCLSGLPFYNVFVFNNNVKLKTVLMSKDYYRILHVEREASADEIKKSFHRLALLHHPDRNSSAVSEDQFKEINEAYQCLSDPQKRRSYDSGSTWFGYYTPQPEPYIHAAASASEVKLNEEFEITYSYIGEGRFFKKPESKAFVFTAGPIVNHRNFLRDDRMIRETQLTYTVSARITGTINVDPATIEVQHRHFSSNLITVNVQSTSCYFKKGMDAGENPLMVLLHKDQFSSNSIYRKTYTYRHAVLVPRSDYAAYYHRIGSIMKTVFAVSGFCLFGLKGQSALLGLVCGSLIAGIACRLMYWMAGVQSKYFYAYQYPLVVEYMEEGYEIGNDSSNIFVSDTVLQRLVMLFK